MQRAVSPSPFGINYGIEYLFMAVVGGAGYVWGALLGSTVILVLKDQLQNWLPKLLDTNANFEMIVFGVLLILMLQYARNGLWPILANWWDGLTGADGSRRNLAPPAPRLPCRRASVRNPARSCWKWMPSARNSAAWWRSTTSASRSAPARSWA